MRAVLFVEGEMQYTVFPILYLQPTVTMRVGSGGMVSIFIEEPDEVDPEILTTDIDGDEFRKLVTLILADIDEKEKRLRLEAEADEKP